jgi:hypothetical protein
MGTGMSGTTPMDEIATTGYDGVMTSIFFRVLLGTATVAASVAATGCSPPEQSVSEFFENAFCNHVLGGPSMGLLESFTANPNLDDALELRRQVVEYNETSQSYAPSEIEDAVSGPLPARLTSST